MKIWKELVTFVRLKNENRVRNLINKQRKGKVRSCTQEELGRMKKGFADLLKKERLKRK